MRLLFIVCFFMSFVSLGQEDLEITLPNFNELKVFDLIQVEIKPSDKNLLKIPGAYRDKVDWVLKKGVLKLRMQLDNSFKGEDVRIVLYTPHLDVIDVNEGAAVVSDQLIKQNKLEVRVQEGAMSRLHVNTEFLELKAVTGGQLIISGSTNHQIIKAGTGATIDNDKLISNHIKVDLKAGGVVNVYASKSIDASVKMGGDVYVKGSPNEVHKKTFAGGDITLLD